MLQFSIFRIISIFATIVVIVMLFGGSIVDLFNYIKVGDIGKAIRSIGDKLLSLESDLNRQTDYLLSETSKSYEERDVPQIMLYFAYALATFFGYFLIFYTLFYFFNSSALSAQTFIFLFVAGLLFFVEYAYANLVLQETIYPLQGVYRFIINIPLIIGRLFYIGI